MRASTERTGLRLGADHLEETLRPAGLSVAFAVALALTGCGDFSAFDDGGGGDVGRPDTGTPDTGVDMGSDVGPGACADGQVEVDGACVTLPSEPDEVCAFVDALGAACVDEDGDCWPASCEGVEPALMRAITDCQDARADVHPRRAEACDGRDNDCDGDEDEDYVDIGDDCAVCGFEGKRECSVNDDGQTACSTAPGQSDAPPPIVEDCDGVDDDCDGRVDELCVVALPPGETVTQPVLCGERALVVRDDALLVIDDVAGPAPAASTLAAAGVVRHPSCDAAGAAWLEVDAPCDEARGLRLCDARLRGLTWGAETSTGLDDDDALGPPVVDGDRVRWHHWTNDGPEVLESGLDGDLARLFDDPASDVTRVAGGRVATRIWRGAEVESLVPTVEIRGVGESGDLPVRNPEALSGPPTLSETWAVWPAGEALWAVPLDDSLEGFQLTRTPGPHFDPQLDGAVVYWLDAGAATPTLRAFDLETGVETAVVRARIEPGDFAVRDGLLLWVEEGARLIRHRPGD